MLHHFNFTPGPSQLYFTAFDHVRQAFKEGIPSLSHRSKTFEQIFRETTDGLRELLHIPAGHHIFFTGSATEIWERILQNLAEEKTFHFVNGAFSSRFYETSLQLGKKAEKATAEEGSGFNDPIAVPAGTEVIAVTQNETSTGVALSADFIYRLKEKNPDALIAVDAVSSLPFPEFDYSRLDSVFFSVQKGFGLPAGLGVWIVNERCVDKAQALAQKGISIGSYHSLPSLLAHAKKNQTPETPNVLGIYLLGRVVQDFLRRGMTAIRRETEYKAVLLYHTLEQHPLLAPFVQDKQFRSKTVVVASCGEHTERLKNYLQERGLHPGSGYGTFKKSQLRFANFPAHSKEQFEMLADALAAFA